MKNQKISIEWTQSKLGFLIFATALSSGVLLISNLAAVKLWNLAGISVDGGVVIFPLAYVLSDLVVEIYGRKLAKWVIWAGFLVNLLAVVTFLIVGKLPAFPGWHGQEAFLQILGFAPRIIAGSLLAYLTSQLLNNVVFEKIKTKTGEKKLFVRVIGSSLVARVADVAIFETVAFLGILSFQEFVRQAVLAYGLGLILELILSPLTLFVVWRVKDWMNLGKEV